MRTIAIVSQKGGVGKTTVAINLSATLAKQGRRVLAVDMDPMGHCAVGTALPVDAVRQTIRACLVAENNAENVDMGQITWQVFPGFDLAPSSPNLAEMDVMDASRFSRKSLAEALSTCGHRYDCCIIDCPSSPGALFANAVYAADQVLIPVETGYFSLRELESQIKRVRALAQSFEKTIDVRAVANQYDVRTKLGREILAELRKQFDGVLLNAVINFNTKLKEGACCGQPITEFAPGSTGAKDFQSLATELLHEDRLTLDRDAIVESYSSRLAADAARLLATSTPLLKNGVPLTPPPVAVPETKQPANAAQADDRNHRRIDEKLAAIYGVRQMEDGIVFRTLCPSAREVLVAGDFNDWTPNQTPLQRIDNNGVFETKLALPRGRYRYRFVIDGRWSYDRDNPQVESNEEGEISSVVEVA